jgi:hypothetical protein
MGAPRWEHPDATRVARDSTLVRVDSVLAAEVSRPLEAMRFTRIQYRDGGNMSCFVIVRTDSVEPEVGWGGSGGGVPAAYRRRCATCTNGCCGRHVRRDSGKSVGRRCVCRRTRRCSRRAWGIIGFLGWRVRPRGEIFGAGGPAARS